MSTLRITMILLTAFLLGCAQMPREFIRIAPDSKSFTVGSSQKRFVPWGNNYAVNEPTGLAEIDWKKVSTDFDDFREMHADVARIHLQVPYFMLGPATPNPQALGELSRLLKLAERKGIYLDITGLASYNVNNRAAWFDSMSDEERWATQACFWEAIAKTCAKSPAVFCYDLMNEPVVSGKRKDGWYAGRMGDYEFVQRLSLDQNGRSSDQISREWTAKMVGAIRAQDKTHLITIGMLPAWGPSPKVVGPMLDFIAVHIYPAAGKVNEALANLQQFDIGKPIVVEETFPLACGVADEREFLLRSRSIAAGWIGQYPSERPKELRKLKREEHITAGQAAYLAWIELFEEIGPAMLQ